MTTGQKLAELVEDVAIYKIQQIINPTTDSAQRMATAKFELANFVDLEVERVQRLILR